MQQIAAAVTLAIGMQMASSVANASGAGTADIEQLRNQHRWLDALAEVSRALEADPQNPWLYRQQALILLDLGSSHRAWTLYRARPELFNEAEIEQLEAAHLARLINWGGLYTESEQARVEELALAEAALQTRRETTTGGHNLRERFDEIVLLNRLERHAEAVELYRALQAERIELPPYALAAVAASLLAERQPTEAIPLFEQVERAQPEDWDARLLLGYAHSESEDFASAYAHLEALKAAEPAWRRAPGARRDHANPRHFDADLNLALLHLYGQDSAGAQRRLESLAAIGPNNGGLQTAVGETYRQRGWSERALERFRMASTLEPEHVGARIGQVGALQDLDRTDLARPLHDRLLSTHPRSPQVRRMARDWDSRLGWHWQLEAMGGRSDGTDASASPLGSRDGGYRVGVQSPLIDDRWRLTAAARDIWADFRGDRVHDRRHGVGLTYAFDRLQAAVGIDRANDGWTNGGTGLYANAGWRLSDTWQLSAGWRRLTPDASLQARRSGISADGLTLGASWTPSDYGRVDAHLQQLRHDDGNRRDSISIDGERRLATRPHLLVDGLAGAYSSRGSRDDAPYFNPSRDGSFRIGTRFDHIAWRHYDRHFRHRLTVMAGPYWQEGFGSAWVPQLRYEHEWKLGTGRLLRYGVNWSRPVYDGVREEYLGFDLAFHWGE